MNLSPQHTVLVDVDTQVDFVEPDGALYVSGAEGLKPRFARLIEAARAAGVTIVASADAHPEGDPEFEQFPPHCLAGSPGAARVGETTIEYGRVVEPDGTSEGAGGDVLLKKTVFDLFANPEADRVIEGTGARTAVVFGVALDYCVRAAALGLRERGYDTVVVTDATKPVTEEGGAKATAELAAAGVRFATTDEVVAAIAG